MRNAGAVTGRALGSSFLGKTAGFWPADRAIKLFGVGPFRIFIALVVQFMLRNWQNSESVG